MLGARSCVACACSARSCVACALSCASDCSLSDAASLSLASSAALLSSPEMVDRAATSSAGQLGVAHGILRRGRARLVQPPRRQVAEGVARVCVSRFAASATAWADRSSSRLHAVSSSSFRSAIALASCASVCAESVS